MNQTFNTGRWWLLVRKHWSENKKKYTLSLIAIAGLVFLWFGVILITDRRGIGAELQSDTYYTGLFLAGCLYGSMMFADLGSKTRGLNYLTIPASQLEKLLCILFYSVVVFFVCYTALFYLIDTIMVKAGNAMTYSYWVRSHAKGETYLPERVLNVFGTPDRHNNLPGFIYYLLLFYFVLQAAFIFGSVYFPKFSFIKTVIALIIAGLLMVFFITKVIAHVLPPGNYYHGISSYQVLTYKKIPGNGIMIYSDAATDKLVTLPGWIDPVLQFLLKFAFAPLFWLATYFRLKEKEI